ncbi:MAG: metallopeptidase TldD-related protein [Bryobacterales bacterium]|nr:metallopeptidase TldD-related protein [Bryobacteraceae bacterium]MDW8130205.1 metallopeptidase TldD-related protein [Bryobacterales bacterium]
MKGLCALLVILPVAARLAAARDPALLTILAEELDRNFRVLREKGDPAPYFMSYQVTERRGVSLAASLGALKSLDQQHGRWLDVTVRVGSPKLDNYRRVPGERVQFTAAMPIPIEDHPAAIKQRVWRETDRTYRLAVERFLKIRTQREVKVAAEDESDDFSREDPAVYVESPGSIWFDTDAWTTRLRRWSAELGRQPGALTSHVNLGLQQEVRYMVNSEGSRIVHGRSFARLWLGVRGKAADGMDLALEESFDAEDASRLPSEEEVLRTIRRLGDDLGALLRAPPADPIAAPAILSGRAAAVFFHEIFGHRIEGHRQKDESEGQTFARSVGQQILPDFLSIVFDPTRRQFAGRDLNGYYLYDDEAVKARPVVVVEKGVLKTFLLSRSPVRGFSRSNGHGRRAPGFEVVSRQSNMIVESSRTVSESRLREMLIEEVRRQGKPYGLYFREVTGGLTQTARAGIQAFRVIPVLVYRVWPDGRADELVRGADIVGTPLAAFNRIVATSDRYEVFNGYCGAESGSVPVAAVAPSVLVSEIEIQKREKSLDRPPFLPPPPGDEKP